VLHEVLKKEQLTNIDSYHGIGISLKLVHPSEMLVGKLKVGTMFFIPL
jgi:hypothetical protein